MQRENSEESSTGSSPPRPGNMVEAWLGLQNYYNEVFICGICSRAFGSIQALGGHQNGHRKERAEEKAAYICQRQHLDANTNAVVINNNDAAAALPHGNLNNINNIINNGFDQVGGPISKRAKTAQEDEGSSVDLTLKVGRGGTGRESGGHMNYNYPDVLFPASEFMDLTVDLDLKL